jgi:hypothetical protein
VTSVDLQTARIAQKQLAQKLIGNPFINGIGINPKGDSYVIKVSLLKEL